MANGFGCLCLDALGTTVGLRFKGYNRTRSVYGSIMTVIVIIIAAVTIAVFGKIYLTGSELYEVNTNLKFWNSQTINFKENYFIAFKTKFITKDSKARNLLLKYKDLIKVKVYLVDQNNVDYKIIRNEIDFVDCKETYFPHTINMFRNFSLSDAKCVNLKGHTIEGNKNTNKHEYFKINYYIDSNEKNFNQELLDLFSITKPSVNLYMEEGINYIDGKKSHIEYIINTL